MIFRSLEMQLLIFLTFLLPSLALNPRIVERFRGNSNEGRVAGGRPVSLGEIPYFAFMQKIDGNSGVVYQCGGSLIKYNWILTVS